MGLEMGMFLLPSGNLKPGGVLVSADQLGSGKTSAIWLWLNSFSWGWTLRRRTECSGILKMVPFLLHLLDA